MKVYVTKYALTKGVFIAEGAYRGEEPYRYFSCAEPHMLFLAPSDYALTSISASAQVRRKVEVRIKSLERSLKKIKEIDFEADIKNLARSEVLP